MKARWQQHVRAMAVTETAAETAAANGSQPEMRRKDLQESQSNNPGHFISLLLPWMSLLLMLLLRQLLLLLLLLMRWLLLLPPLLLLQEGACIWLAAGAHFRGAPYVSPGGPPLTPGCWMPRRSLMQQEQQHKVAAVPVVSCCCFYVSLCSERQHLPAGPLLRRCVYTPQLLLGLLPIHPKKSYKKLFQS